MIINTSIIKPLDLIACPALAFEGVNVALRHPSEARLVLVPLSWIEEDDDEQFTATHRKAAFRGVEFLEGKDWQIIGSIARKWVTSGVRSWR